MAKKRTKPGDWFVTQDEFKVMLYAIASDYNALKARTTALESEVAELRGRIVDPVADRVSEIGRDAWATVLAEKPASV